MEQEEEEGGGSTTGLIRFACTVIGHAGVTPGSHNGQSVSRFLFA